MLVAKSHQPASPGDIKVLIHCGRIYLLTIPLNVLLNELGLAELSMAQDPPWLSVGGTPLWHSQPSCFGQRPKEALTKLPFYKSPLQAHFFLPFKKFEVSFQSHEGLQCLFSLFFFFNQQFFWLTPGGIFLSGW